MQILANIQKMEINGGKIEVEHKGETVSFIFSTFKKENFVDNNEVFLHINNYWKIQKEEKQSKIFQIYKEVEDCFDDILNKDSLTDRLKDLVKELFDLHPIPDLKSWLINYSGILIPPDFKELYVEDPDRNTTVDKTYVREDYRELLTLSLILRIMVPIWATYVRHIRSHTGNGLKELKAFELLEKTPIPKSQAISKLLKYITANFKKDEANIPVNFLTEEDFPYWVLTLTCVRRLCVGEFQSKNPKANLVTLISNFVDTKTNYTDGDFSKQIKDKKATGVGEDENKLSTMECFRINTEISVGESEELKFSVENIYMVAERVCIGLPHNLLDRCLETSNVLKSHVIYNPQKSFMSWVLKDAISAEGLNFLEKDSLIRCLALTQAVLWFKGFEYLSLLSTAVSPLETSHRVSHMPTKTRMPENIQKKIREVFPHVRISSNKKSPFREECLITNDIEILSTELSNRSWRGTAEKEMIQKVFGVESNTKIAIVPDIRIKLAELIIAVGTNQLSN